MIEQIHELCRGLLLDGTVQVIIGYGQDAPNTETYPIFVTKPEDVSRLVWNPYCYANLTNYILRKDVQALGKIAVMVKGCDERTLVVLEQESQIDRANLYVIGLACEGVGKPETFGKCLTCDVRNPRIADTVIGQVERPAPKDDRYEALNAFLQKSPEERMAFWQKEFERCIKCYACRQSCPLCYCNRCIADKNRPTVLDTSATLKGNFAWNITRAFHLAGRCIGCGECARACPAGINLSLLNQTLARAAEENFEGYRAGMDTETPPVIGSYSLQDKEEFIR